MRTASRKMSITCHAVTAHVRPSTHVHTFTSRRVGIEACKGVADEKAERLGRAHLVVGHHLRITATGNRGEVGFGDRDRALKQAFVPPRAVRRHPLPARPHGDPSMIEIIAGQHVPDLHFVIVNRLGCHVDLTGIGELWDAQTLASVRWRGGTTASSNMGASRSRTAPGATFTNRDLMMQYVKAQWRVGGTETALHQTPLLKGRRNRCSAVTPVSSRAIRCVGTRTRHACGRKKRAPTARGRSWGLACDGSGSRSGKT